MNSTFIDSINFQKDVIGNVRTAQEDSHDIAELTPNGDVFVVCDGMGGHVGGKQASSIAVKSIIEYLEKERYPQPQQALNDALQFANMQILGYANEHPELKGMGTTACIVLIQDSEAYIAHVGDSRIYLYFGKEKKLHRITKDHSFVQTLVDAGQITDEEAEHHPNKNRILKALGIKPDLAPTFNHVSPKEGDIFLLCSDGLSGMISDYTIRECLEQNSSLEDRGETLINLALEAGGLDNITLELVQITNSPHAKTVVYNYNQTTATSQGDKKRFKPNKTILNISVIAAVFVLMGLSFVFKIQTEKKNIHKWQQEINSINDSLEQRRLRRASLTAKMKEIEKEIDSLEKKIDASNNGGQSDLNDQRKKLRDTIEDIKKTQNTLESQIKKDSMRKGSLNNNINNTLATRLKLYGNEGNNGR